MALTPEAISTTRTGHAPRHAGERSTALKDMAVRIRYVFRYVFSTREHAAYATTVSLRGAH